MYTAKRSGVAGVVLVLLCFIFYLLQECTSARKPALKLHVGLLLAM